MTALGNPFENADHLRSIFYHFQSERRLDLMYTVQLWNEVPGMCEETPVLDCYIPEEKKSDVAMVILPGGGYRGRVEHEGKGFAEYFNQRGITAFVCHYRVSPHTFPLPLLDARRAIRYVRYHCEEFGINKNKVYIIGSSAGGHLAAMTSSYNDTIEFEGLDEIDNENFRPNAQILCYPVINLADETITHLGSAQHLLGDRYPADAAKCSPDLYADEQTPPTFIWHNCTDKIVNVTNALEYAKRLRSVNVPVELHVFPYGFHGMATCPNDPYIGTWTDHMFSWMELIESENMI